MAPSISDSGGGQGRAAVISAFRFVYKVYGRRAYGIFAFFLFWFFDDHKTVGFGTAMGLGMGAIAAGCILLAGYVYGDAVRRGMPAVAWTALALLVPNGIGFVLYFLLRKPIVHPCSGCGYGVAGMLVFARGAAYRRCCKTH